MESASPLANATGTAPEIGEFALNEGTMTFRAPDPNSRTILVVEDNEIVSDFLQSALRAYGYQAVTAATPDQAVEHCERHRNSIYALIADVKLGCFEGFQTSQKLLEICPQMKVVYTSGYPHEHLVRLGLLPNQLGASRFIQKPFLPSELKLLLESLQLPS
jgi:two-component system cell cycle sensor histidine kinase/response regulator CckA